MALHKGRSIYVIWLKLNVINLCRALKFNASFFY